MHDTAVMGHNSGAAFFLQQLARQAPGESELTVEVLTLHLAVMVEGKPLVWLTSHC